MERKDKKGCHIKWEEPVVIELSTESEAEGACVGGSSASNECNVGGLPGGPGPAGCTFGPTN